MQTSRHAQFGQGVVGPLVHDVPPLPTALFIELLMTDFGLSFDAARSIVLDAIAALALPAEQIGRG